MDIYKGIDNEIGIDITYSSECKTLWLRFLCFFITFHFKNKAKSEVEDEQ